MDYKIVWSHRSVTNLQDIVAYIAEDNPVAALKVGETLLDKVLPLSQFPQMGKIFSKLGRADIRELAVPPYRIIYQIVEAESLISIVTVWHGARLESNIW